MADRCRPLPWSRFCRIPAATRRASLVTLHLPVDHYPPEALSERVPGRYFNCVSASQRRSFPESGAMLPEIPNGVPVARLQARHAKRQFALALGRICPEKGFHDALDAAALAQIPLVIAGRVFPYEDHERYFADRDPTALGTSGAICGESRFCPQTPFSDGSALPVDAEPHRGNEFAGGDGGDRLRHPGRGVSGGRSARHHRAGCHRLYRRRHTRDGRRNSRSDSIDREHCREIARQRFSQERMIEAYFGYYRRLPQRKLRQRRWSA